MMSQKFLFAVCYGLFIISSAVAEKARLKHIHKNHNVAVRDGYTYVVENTADPKFYCKKRCRFHHCQCEEDHLQSIFPRL